MFWRRWPCLPAWCRTEKRTGSGWSGLPVRPNGKYRRLLNPSGIIPPRPSYKSKPPKRTNIGCGCRSIRVSQPSSPESTSPSPAAARRRQRWRRLLPTSLCEKATCWCIPSTKKPNRRCNPEPKSWGIWMPPMPFTKSGLTRQDGPPSSHWRWKPAKNIFSPRWPSRGLPIIPTPFCGAISPFNPERLSRMAEWPPPSFS